MKPTYGRVSRFGMIAFASSLDQAGPFATTVRGSAMLLKAIAGKDPRDSTSIDAPVPDYTDGIGGGVAGMKLGVPREYFVEGMDAGTEKAVRAALAKLEELGATLVDVSLPHTEYAVATYYIVATAEASSNLGRYDGVRYGIRRGEDEGLIEMYGKTRDAGFGTEVKRRIMLGTYALSAGYYDAYYLTAMKVRTLIRNDFDRAFEQCDALVMPTAASSAFERGARTADPLQMYLSDILTISTNLAGLPGISIPCGFDDDAMPVGLQIVTPALEEGRMFRVAAAFEWRPHERIRTRRLGSGHRTGSPRPAEDRNEAVLRLLGPIRRDAERAHVPRVPRHARRAARLERTGGGVRDSRGFGDELQDQRAQHLGAQKLFLPRPAEGLPDQPVRRAVLRTRRVRNPPRGRN
jgi:aspartyl-tRNA(Asn)/glutamyl-tRNA(Gln) amidotransferase subunit A